MYQHPHYFYFFFFNDTATTEIYTLSLHDALPILSRFRNGMGSELGAGSRGSLECNPADSGGLAWGGRFRASEDRKSTRLNSSHGYISYAVFCLKKKKTDTDLCECKRFVLSFARHR